MIDLREYLSYLPRQRGGIEAVDGGGVGDLKGDGFDGRHGDQASYGSASCASRFLTGMVACFTAHVARYAFARLPDSSGGRARYDLAVSPDQVAG
jgi:hypothetical protein